MILGFGLLDKTNIVKVSLWVILTAFLTIFRFFTNKKTLMNVGNNQQIDP